MITNRETYNPDFRREAEAIRTRNEELRTGKNRDDDLLKQLTKLTLTVDKLILSAIKPHRELPKSSSEYSKVFSSLVSLGIITNSMFNDFQRFWSFKNELENRENYEPREITISRHSPSEPDDDRMSGSILTFSREQMKEEIKRAKKLEKEFSRSFKRVKKHQDELKKIFG